jgi:AcrR family transcriptional regulator
MGAKHEELLDRFTLAVAQHGCDEAAVELALSRARISPTLFRKHFDSFEGCFLEVCERALAQLGPTLAYCYEAEDCWRDSLGAALAGLLEQLDANLPLAILLVVRTVEGGPRVQVYRARVLDELAGVLDRGALETPEGVVCPTRPVAVALVEQLLTLIHDRLLRTNTHPRLLELHPLLMSIALATYLGTDAAAEALAGP